MHPYIYVRLISITKPYNILLNLTESVCLAIISLKVIYAFNEVMDPGRCVACVGKCDICLEHAQFSLQIHHV